jgi:putative two-component system response regulator
MNPLGSSPPGAPGTRILIADDDDGVRRSLARLLSRHGYTSRGAADAEDAIAELDRYEFDVLLCDIDMPGISGLELLEQMSAYPDIATVIVTGKDDPNIASVALERGAYGYVIKPFEPNEILINIANALRRLGLEQESRRQQGRLEEMVKERTNELWRAIGDLERAYEELRDSRTETVERLSLAAEFRDDETARHIQRMSRYCELLALRQGYDTQDAESLRVAAVMHDVGKIGIPDSILLKPGPLTDDERTVIETHSEIGYRILKGSNSEVLKLGATIAFTHHERMDGEGYPRGLRGGDIPIEGRIVAIADVFDALTTDRVYRRALPLGEAIGIMNGGRRSQFDGELLDVFLEGIDEVLVIQGNYIEARS